MSDAQERAMERALKLGDMTALPALIRHRERRGVKTISDEALEKIRNMVCEAIHCRGIVDVALVTKTDSVGDPLVEVTLEHDMSAHDDESCCESGVEYVCNMLSDISRENRHGRRDEPVSIAAIAVVIRIIDPGHSAWAIGDFSAHDAEAELDMLMRQADDLDVDPPECFKNHQQEGK